MRCVEPVGHAAAVEGLWRAARAGRLAHALLLEGRDGIGKHLAAEWLASGLLCASGPGRPCGACGPEKRLRAGVHPDAFVLDPESEGEEQIKIGRITARADDPQANVAGFLSLRPMEGGARVVLIRDAHRLNEASQNAFLKTLEEPGQGALLVLSTSRPDLLLETTRSRCLRIALEPLPVDAAAAIVRAQGIEPGLALQLARWSRGAPGAALSLAAQGAAGMRAILERLIAGEIDALGATAELDEVRGEFPGRTPAAAARARARAFQDLLLALVGDLRAVAAGADPATLAHGDFAGANGALVARKGEAALALALDRALEARQDVDSNLAPEAAVERALLALERLATHPRGRVTSVPREPKR